MGLKATPRPWKKTPYRHQITATFGVKSGGVWIAKCHPLNGETDDLIEAEANAVLIAAAPDLLEACEYVVQYHRDNDSGEGELFGLDFVTTCINAIRKAKGGM